MGPTEPAQFALTFSSGIPKIPGLARLLGVDAVVRHSPFRPPGGNRRAAMVIGWGNKPNTQRAQEYAARHRLPYLALEDGFLRSVGLGVDGEPPLSVVVDDLGIHYDARRPSRLERILLDDPDDPELLERARSCIGRIRRERLSKYNSAPEVTLPPGDRPRVLVIDQTAGDLSIAGALAGPESFQHMLAAARRENPEAELLVKIHPDVGSGRRQGHLTQADVAGPVRILDRPVNPIHLLQQVDRVYTVSSQMGFEALLAGRPVTCFGVPFYAGWGLTDDRVPAPRRGRPRTLEQLFAAACLLYSRYIDPETGEPCTMERVIDHLALQYRQFRRNSGTILCYRFVPWKRGYVRRYLQSPWNRVRFVERLEEIERSGDDPDIRIAVWGLDCPTEVADLATRRQIPVWRVEDGFIRSVGLGKSYIPPLSLVVDRSGIYFDPTAPSDLERILQQADFSTAELERAEALIRTIVASRLSKYNVGRGEPLRTGARPGQPVLLIPGQVEDDASIRAGCPGIRSNRQLVERVRRERPDAFLLYKPHPDVVSGHLANPGDDAGALADQVVTDATIDACIEVADEVHTLTSLTGFEALLRGRRVVTYGQPFYAGWGLTTDHRPPARRSRHLRLAELVAGCLLRYPCYLDFRSGRFTTPERVLSLLQEELAGQARPGIRTTRLGRKWRKLLFFARGLYDHARQGS